MKIIIDTLDIMPIDQQLAAVREYIKTRKIGKSIMPTPKDSAIKIYTENYNPVHVLCKINPKSVYFKTWHAV